MYSRLLIAAGVLAGAAGAASCSRTYAELTPAPSATPVPGTGQGAVATAGGVRVVARAQAWHFDPADLNTKATPLLIQLENDGDHSVQVRYNRIWLTDAAGQRYNAMPPYDIDGSVTETYTVENPYYGFSRFSVAPYLSRWYPRFLLYRGAFAYDPAYYRPYVTRYRDVALPTAEMVRRALPEGVLDPGGRAEGFVYFESFRRGDRQLTLNVEMVDANSGTTIGTAQIAFVTG